MAKESLIRQKATEKLLQDGWVINIPTRTRFGSSNTYWLDKNGDKERKGTDDIFSIIDLLAWKDNELLLVQYTSKTGVLARIKKINKFIKKHNIKIPDGVKIEVWGYENRVGFERVEEIN